MCKNEPVITMALYLDTPVVIYILLHHQRVMWSLAG